MSTRIHPKTAPQKRTSCGQKCPRDVTPFVQEKSPIIMSTRCLPPLPNPLTQNRLDLWFGRGWYYTPLKNWLLRVYLVFREYLFFVNGTNVSFTVNDEVQFYADEKQCRRPSMDLQMQNFFYQTLLTWKYTNIHIINTFYA